MEKSILKQKLRVIGIILLAIICTIILIVSLGAASKHFKALGYNVIGNILSFLIVVVTTLGVIIFNKKVNKLGAKDYGFHLKKIDKSIVIGFGVSILIISAVLLIAHIFFNIQTEWIGLKNDFQKPLLLSLIVTFLIAVWEEVFFRGLIYNTLFKNNFGFHQSALISTIIFSLVHWSSFDMQTTSWFWYLGIALIGYILVILYSYTNSIWTAIIFHFSWNFLVDLMVENENEVGIYTVINYEKYSKTIDNIEVFLLGVTLIILLSLIGKKLPFKV